MKPFYLTKKSNGYYQVRFSDTKTGRLSVAKSTHKKSYNEAFLTACRWLAGGIPLCRVDSHSDTSLCVEGKIFVDSLVMRLKKNDITKSDLVELIRSITCRCGLEKFIRFDESDQEKNSCRYDRLAVVKLLEDFWTPEKSQYIEERRAHGHYCGRRYCSEMRNIVSLYVKSYFGNRSLDSIDSAQWNDFFLYLKSRKCLSGNTVNKVFGCCRIFFSYAKRHSLISENPLCGIERFSSEPRKRGILSDDEVKKLFSAEWKFEDTKLGNELAAFCGLRLGEIQALRVKDVGNGFLTVEHGYNPIDGLKDTKNHKSRIIPVPHMLCERLMVHAKSNPYYSQDSYVFFGRTDKSIPLDGKRFRLALVSALNKIGITGEERLRRNIVFHSWRHYYASVLAGRVKMNQVQQMLGHLTPAMTVHYADHAMKQNFEAVAREIESCYKSIHT